MERGARGVLIPGTPAKVRGYGRGGEMVVWKEAGGGFIQEGVKKREVSCQVSIHKAGSVGYRRYQDSVWCGGK